MDRDEALELLRGGEDGVAEWNRWRVKGGEIPSLSSAHLIRAELSGANLSGADLSGASLNRADLRGADLSGADLRDASLSGANLHVAKLRGANLSGASLNRADLRDAELSGANLRGASLIRADLSGASLNRADLRGANLSGANLSGANLIDADLRAADLDGADLSHASLSGANLSDAMVYYTTFGNLNLSVVKSLDVNHQGPSTLGIDTILKSGGKIPAAFLEGCGVPDTWIKYLPSLIGNPIELFSAFISYSHQDEEFTKRLHSRMREDKLRVWYAPEDMKGGRELVEQIDSAIKLHDKLLIVLTEHSMKSDWVKTEIRKARKREAAAGNGNRILFPIRLVPFEVIRDWEAFDADTGADMAVEIRNLFIPDFTNWKDHDSFEAAYQRLMKDFKPAPEDG